MKYNKLIILVWIIFCSISNWSHGQGATSATKNVIIEDLIDSMWVNPISFFNKDDPNWRLLCQNLQLIDWVKINQIVHSVFSDSARAFGKIENDTDAFVGMIGWLNKKSHNRKSRKFNHQVKRNTLNPNHKTVLIEGDSWFEYPLFLHEITDQLTKKPNIAAYSMAAGGDWIANIISSQQYQNKYKNLKPDVFIISGGGNDLVQDGRLINYISETPISINSSFLNDHRKYIILRMNNKAVPLCKVYYCPIEYHLYDDFLVVYQKQLDTLLIEKIVNRRRYLSKEYYQLLVSLKLEYKILFESIRKIAPDHFDSLKITTQGYDYAIPYSSRKFGVNLLLNNGEWLQKPLESIGITDSETQESIIMSMMFDFNEMLIELGKEYPNIYHIDVRGFTRFMENKNDKKKGAYWFDELHPTNYIFEYISRVYYFIIMDEEEREKRIFNLCDYYSN